LNRIKLHVLKFGISVGGHRIDFFSEIPNSNDAKGRLKGISKASKTMEINATQHLGRLRLYSTRLQNGGFDLGSWVGTGTVCEDVRCVSDFQGGFSLFFLLLFHDNNCSDSTHFEDN